MPDGDDVPWGDGNLSVSWYVMNTTDRTLILKCPYSESLLSNDYEYREFEIEPLSIHGIIICRGKNLRNEDADYDSYIQRSAEVLGEDVSWRIFSEDGMVLKTWKYSERDLPERRFFEKKEWEWEASLSLSSVWRFYITDELIEEMKSAEL